jgi:two-component system, NtrC family, sensor histidine kinase PilS
VSVQRPAAVASVPIAPAWPTLQTFALVRSLVSTALLLAVLVFGAQVIGRALGAGPARLLGVLGTYFAVSMLLVAWPILRQTRFNWQLAAHLAADVALVSLLVVQAGGVRSGVFIFFLLPLAEAALALPTVVAFFVCSLAVLVLLVNEGVRGLQGDAGEAQMFQAGVVGAALFGITALLRLLSTRLSSQEQLARARGRELHSQLQINRLVISQMEQGVIVVDAAARVRANNRAARVLLGFDADAQLTGRRLLELPLTLPLANAYLNWLDGVEHDGSGLRSDTVIQLQGGAPEGGGGRPRRVRVRFARPAYQTSDEFVIFLEDLQAIEEQAQRLKLAAMGRLTASIAHEIRNPLAAISQAGQLLAEEAHDPMQQRLTSIVRENTLRLNRLVEDVLRAARRDSPMSDEFDLHQFCVGWLEEFSRDRRLAEGAIALAIEPGIVIKVEQGHLRQVLFNLVDNGLRYCSGRPGSIEIRADPGDGRDLPVRLWVFDDGAGVPQADRDAMFEPFFTTHARGTGLGLYLAREFCVANGIDLTYESRQQGTPPPRFGFCLRFGSPPVLREEEPDFMDTLPAP